MGKNSLTAWRSERKEEVRQENAGSTVWVFYFDALKIRKLKGGLGGSKIANGLTGERARCYNGAQVGRFAGRKKAEWGTVLSEPGGEVSGTKISKRREGRRWTVGWRKGYLT